MLVPSLLIRSLKNEYFPALVDGNPEEMPDFKTITVFKIEGPDKNMDYIPEGCE